MCLSDCRALYTIGVNDTLCKSIICDDEEKGNVMGDKSIKFDGVSRGCVIGNAKQERLKTRGMYKKQAQQLVLFKDNRLIDRDSCTHCYLLVECVILFHDLNSSFDVARLCR
eukprot:358572_1